MIPPGAIEVQHATAGVLLSLGIAVVASLLGIELVARLHRTLNTSVRRIWLALGALSLGTGIWAMHFVGMASAQLPFASGYDAARTAASWLAAVAVAAALLVLATRPRMTPAMTVCGSFAAGAAASAMHHLGMSALVVAPAVRYDAGWIALSVVAAGTGMWATLLATRQMQHSAGTMPPARQLVAALVLGSSLATMHYTAMQGVSFADGTLCLSRGGLDLSALGSVTGLGALLMLSLMLGLAYLQRWTDAREAQARVSLDKAEAELRYVTFTDVLTGLPNRLMFQDRLKQAIARRGPGRQIVLAMVDIDGLRLVNGSLGEAAGDDVVRQAAERMGGVVVAPDTLACAGGDRFLILWEQRRDASDAIALAQAVRASLDAPFRVGSRVFSVTASIGLTLAPAGGDDSALVVRADAALVAVKAAGGNATRFFEPSMDAAARFDAELLHDLRQAVGAGGLHLVYQPKIDARSRQVTGVEALVRWSHARHGPIGPDVFIPLAERNGVIQEIGRWVLDEACRQMKEWRDDGLDMRVAVNLSMHQLLGEQIVVEVDDALKRHGVASSRLTCEITESVAMGDPALLHDALVGLRDLGVALSIDDFGTGYSSLSYLRRMPIHQLKIDRSFVRDLGDSEDAQAVVEAIVRMAHALRLEVVAEGVETERQRRVLDAMGVDKHQGYLFARPMTAAAILDMARRVDDRPVAFRASLYAELA